MVPPSLWPSGSRGDVSTGDCEAVGTVLELPVREPIASRDRLDT